MCRLLPIIATIGSLLFCSCNKKAELELEAQVAEFKAKEDAIAAELAKQGDLNEKLSRDIATVKATASRLEDLKKEQESRAGEQAVVSKYYSDLKISQEFLDERLAVWRKASRESMMDRDIGTVRLTSGDVLRKSIVKSIEEEGVTLEHSRGTSTVPWRDPPLELRERLVHEPTILAKQQIKGGL